MTAPGGGGGWFAIGRGIAAVVGAVVLFLSTLAAGIVRAAARR